MQASNAAMFTTEKRKKPFQINNSHLVVFHSLLLNADPYSEREKFL